MIQVKWTKDDDFFVRSAVEQLINAWEDFAYGYDLEEEAEERIIETLEDIGIDCEVVEEDIL